MQSNRTFPRKVDRERITIGSFLAHRFGLRILARGVFSKRVRKMLATTFSIFLIFYGCFVPRQVSGWNLMFWASGMMNLGSEGAYLHEKCGTNASRYLPGPKTLVENKSPSFNRLCTGHLPPKGGEGLGGGKVETHLPQRGGRGGPGRRY